MEQQLPTPYPDNRLLINDGELKLQRLAAIVVAIEVLPYNLSSETFEEEKIAKTFATSWWLDSHGRKIVEKLFNPKKIQDLLHEPVEFISFEIGWWMEYHIPQVFLEWQQRRRDFVLKFIRHFVWNSLGTIDYVKTAEKWIADDDLEISFQQKYRLACLNCLENTIENLRSENPEMADGEKGLPLVSYWNCKMAGVNFNLAGLVSTPPYVPIWSYFLKQMNEEERYSFSIGSLMNFPPRAIKDLLPKFTETEQRRLFEKKLHVLMRLFVIHDYPHFALQLWRYVNDTVSAKMYDDVFDDLYNIDECFEGSSPEWHGDLGMEMWRCASDNLKEKMFQYKNGEFLCKWIEWYNNVANRSDPPDATFLLEMLSEASPEYRKQFWFAHWKEIMSDCDCESECFAKLIKACLPEPYDRNKFLKNFENSSEVRNLLKNLFEDFKFVELAEFVDQFVQDAEIKADLKKCFVPSANDLSKQCEFQSMSEKNFKALSILLMDVYGSEVSIEYKAKFIRSGFIRCISNQRKWDGWFLEKGEWKPMGKAKHESLVSDAEKLCSGEELQTIRQTLLEEREFFETLAKEKENTIVWDDLLKWLVGGKQAIEDRSK